MGYIADELNCSLHFVAMCVESDKLALKRQTRKMKESTRFDYELDKKIFEHYYKFNNKTRVVEELRKIGIVVLLTTVCTRISHKSRPRRSKRLQIMSEEN